MNPKGRLMLALSVGLLSGPAYAQTPVRRGPEFQVNTYTTSGQDRPSVGVDPDGNFVVVWQSYGSNGTDISLFSVQGQRFSLGDIFSDGFESGDTSAWSGTLP